MKRKKIYRFEAVLEKLDGEWGFSFVIFPFDVEQEFGTRAHVRVVGTLDEIPIDRSLLPRSDGTHLIVINTELRKKAKIKTGDTIQVQVWREAYNDTPEQCEELNFMLEESTKLKTKFEKLNPGTKRQIAYWIGTAKQAETRAKRAVLIIQRLESDSFHFGGKKIEV